MKHQPPILCRDLIDAFVASAVAWAVRLLQVLLAPGAQRRRRRLHRLVQRLERRVECILFLDAVLRLGPPPRGRRRRGSLQPGFRRRCGSVRHFLKSARIRARNATPVARLFHALAALFDGERYVARFMRRLARGLHFGGMVACAPPPVALRSDGPRACAFADSS